MNENIDLTKILKDCPKGTELYSPVFGKVYFKEIRNDDDECPIVLTKGSNITAFFTKKGFYYSDLGEECVLFPSKDLRDWSKFTAPWYKKEKFDPKTLKPFDRVLGFFNGVWNCDLYSNCNGNKIFPYVCFRSSVSLIIPYNDDTKHLVGTSNDAPDYYRYWED